MTLDRLINIVVNTVIRRLVNAGINRGIALFSRRGKAAGPLIPPEAKHRQEARAAARRARQAAKITRRLGR